MSAPELVCTEYEWHALTRALSARFEALGERGDAGREVEALVRAYRKLREAGGLQPAELRRGAEIPEQARR